MLNSNSSSPQLLITLASGNLKPSYCPHGHPHTCVHPDTDMDINKNKDKILNPYKLIFRTEPVTTADLYEGLRVGSMSNGFTKALLGCREGERT